MASKPVATEDVARAGLWSGLDVLGRQGLQFVITIALARLLSPQEFGTIALLAVFTSLLTMALEGGANIALQRTLNSTHVQELTVFWFNLAAGLAAAAAMVLIAPAVARFYGIPLLTPLIGVAAIQMIVVSAGAIHTTLLVRDLRFRPLLLVGTSATVVSGSLAIVLALEGFGVWTLSLQALCAALVNTGLLWFANNWRPAWRFSFAEARALFRFGRHMVISGVLDVLYTQGFALLIGRMYGMRDVGFYTRAQNTQALPNGIISNIIARITLPLLAARQGDIESLKRAVRRATRLSFAISMPVMLGLACLADTAVALLYGPKWAPTAPILTILAALGALFPHAVLMQQGMLAQDKSRAYLHLIASKQALGLVTMVIGSFFGIMGLAYSQIVYGIGSTLLNAHAAQRHFGYTLREQAQDLAGMVVIAVVMAGALTWVSSVTSFTPLAEAVVLVPAGAAIYAGLALAFRITPVLEASKMALSVLPRSRGN